MADTGAEETDVTGKISPKTDSSVPVTSPGRHRDGLRGKTILIAGASSGIGREVALQLARYDTSLVVSARNAPMLDSLARRSARWAADAWRYRWTQRTAQPSKRR